MRFFLCTALCLSAVISTNAMWPWHVKARRAPKVLMFNDGHGLCCKLSPDGTIDKLPKNAKQKIPDDTTINGAYNPYNQTEYTFIRLTKPGEEGLFALGTDGTPIKLVEPPITGFEKMRLLSKDHFFPVGKCVNGVIISLNSFKYVVINYGTPKAVVYQVDVGYNIVHFSDVLNQNVCTTLHMPLADSI